MYRSIGTCTKIAGVVLTCMLVTGSPALAQDKAKSAAPQVVTKVLLENDKVRVYESRFKPGAESASRERKPRVSYAVKGGTLLRTYPDGKTVKSERKTGAAEWLDRDTYAVKNIGKTEVVLVAVEGK
jgi:hypothetical protein